MRNYAGLRLPRRSTIYGHGVMMFLSPLGHDRMASSELPPHDKDYLLESAPSLNESL